MARGCLCPFSPLFSPSNSQTLKNFKDPWEPWCMIGWLIMLLFTCVMSTSTEGAYLYSEEASCAAIGTNLANRSGPVTVGSVGFTGRAFTRGAPLRAQRSWFYCDRNTYAWYYEDKIYRRGDQNQKNNNPAKFRLLCKEKIKCSHLTTWDQRILTFFS